MAVLMLCSCNEMENAPTNKFTDNSYWTSTTKAQYVVNMAYSQMYNAGRMWSDESLSDNAYDGRSVDDQRAIRKGMATPSLDIFKNEWKDLYGGIKTCHVFLEKVDMVPNMDASVKARMIAEILYIRASLYFRLTNLYGAVPFFTEDITLEESRSVSRTDRETIISFIHQELEDIKDALPTRDQLPEEDKGKITKGAVCALQARVYLMDSDWNNVMLYCDNLMNKQPPLTSIFLIAELSNGYGLFIPLMITACISFAVDYYLDPDSIYTKQLRQKGALLTHDKDQSVFVFLKLAELMETDFLRIKANMTLGDIGHIISTARRNIFPVIDNFGRLIGVVQLDDLREDMFKHEKYGHPISDYMIPPPDKIIEHEAILSVMEKFEDKHAWMLPVVDKQGRYLGFISKSRILNAYREQLVKIQQ